PVGVVEHGDAVLPDAQFRGEVWHRLGARLPAQIDPYRQRTALFVGPHRVDAGPAGHVQDVSRAQLLGQVEERHVERGHGRLPQQAVRLAGCRAGVAYRSGRAAVGAAAGRELLAVRGVPVRLHGYVLVQGFREVVDLERGAGRVLAEPGGVAGIVVEPAGVV